MYYIWVFDNIVNVLNYGCFICIAKNENEVEELFLNRKNLQNKENSICTDNYVITFGHIKEKSHFRLPHWEFNLIRKDYIGECFSTPTIIYDTTD